MAAPRPYVATKTGSASAAPAGSVPIEIYGVSGGGAGGPVDIGDVTGLQAALNSKLDETTFDAYTASAETAFEGLEQAVATNTTKLASTTATANTAVQPDNKRLPIVLTRAAYDALNPPVTGQVYYIQG